MIFIRQCFFAFDFWKRHCSYAKSGIFSRRIKNAIRRLKSLSCALFFWKSVWSTMWSRIFLDSGSQKTGVSSPPLCRISRDASWRLNWAKLANRLITDGVKTCCLPGKHLDETVWNCDCRKRKFHAEWQTRDSFPNRGKCVFSMRGMQRKRWR